MLFLIDRHKLYQVHRVDVWYKPRYDVYITNRGHTTHVHQKESRLRDVNFRDCFRHVTHNSYDVCTRKQRSYQRFWKT